MIGSYFLKCEELNTRVHTTDPKVRDELVYELMVQVTEFHYSTLEDYNTLSATEYLHRHDDTTVVFKTIKQNSPLEDRLSRTTHLEPF